MQKYNNPLPGKPSANRVYDDIVRFISIAMFLVAKRERERERERERKYVWASEEEVEGKEFPF
jgi:hypothetical protein